MNSGVQSIEYRQVYRKWFLNVRYSGCFQSVIRGNYPGVSPGRANFNPEPVNRQSQAKFLFASEAIIQFNEKWHPGAAIYLKIMVRRVYLIWQTSDRVFASQVFYMKGICNHH